MNEVAIDPHLIPGRKPVLAVKVRLAKMLAKETIEVIKAAESGQMSVNDATLVVSMNKGTAQAADCAPTYLQKVYEMGAGMKGLVVTEPVDVEELRLGDRLVGIEGVVHVVVRAPYEVGDARSERVDEIVVRRDRGQFTYIRVDELSEWGLLD